MCCNLQEPRTAGGFRTDRYSCAGCVLSNSGAGDTNYKDQVYNWAEGALCLVLQGPSENGQPLPRAVQGGGARQ